MVLVPEAYRNHPDLQKDYPEVCAALFTPSSMRSCITQHFMRTLDLADCFALNEVSLTGACLQLEFCTRMVVH